MTQTMNYSAQPEFAPVSLSRMLELESENIRLHLLVSELLIKNQQLREAVSLSPVDFQRPENLSSPLRT